MNCVSLILISNNVYFVINKLGSNEEMVECTVGRHESTTYPYAVSLDLCRDVEAGDPRLYLFDLGGNF